MNVNAVGDGENLGHRMTDQHNGKAVFAHPANEIEHLMGFANAERGGRLVEDHDLAAPGRSARHRHRLTLAA